MNILACPNCGNSTDFSYNCYEMAGDGPILYEAHIQCLNCDLSTGIACPFGTKAEAKEEATGVWNRAVERMSGESASLRAELTALREKHEALREAATLFIGAKALSDHRLPLKLNQKFDALCRAMEE